MTRLSLTLALLGAACAPGTPLVRVSLERTTQGVVLTLHPAPGARINARLKPAFELPDGSVLRLDSPHVTADSAYFTAPPTVLLPSTAARSGVLRASVCPQGQSVCRTLEHRVRL